MASLSAIFGGSAARSQDSEKLLNLYWNRAELKKEFARLRKEQYKLEDRVKQQEGVAARLQQNLDQLERLLIDPAGARNVLVFYQLRGLGLRCERKLARFAEQLKQQREQRKHNSLLVLWNESRTREMKAVERKLADTRQAIEDLDDRLQAERRRLASMSIFMRLFRRRSVTAALDRLAAQIDAAVQQEGVLKERHAEIRNRRPPENQGLDLGTKRSINFMILSFTQQLLLDFKDSDLATLAREASDKSAGSINYGTPGECDELLKRIQKRLDMMERNTDFAPILQRRALLLAEKALFRSDGDAVPIAGSVTTVYDIDGHGTVSRSDANLLGEDYWGIAKVLSR